MFLMKLREEGSGTGVVREFICIAVLQRHTGAVSIPPPAPPPCYADPEPILCCNLMRDVSGRACKE